jgi:hypothetical protein
MTTAMGVTKSDGAGVAGVYKGERSLKRLPG